MKVLAWVLGALVVASLHEKVHCQCNGGGTWEQSTYTVNEGGSITITAVLASPLSTTVVLRWTTVSGSATGID